MTNYIFLLLSLLHSQGRKVWKRLIINSFKQKDRYGSYWSINSDINGYGLKDTLKCRSDEVERLSMLPVNYRRIDYQNSTKLINWGYAVCDAAIRRHVDKTFLAPESFPYPENAI